MHHFHWSGSLNFPLYQCSILRLSSDSTSHFRSQSSDYWTQDEKGVHSWCHFFVKANELTDEETLIKSQRLVQSLRQSGLRLEDDIRSTLVEESISLETPHLKGSTSPFVTLCLRVPASACVCGALLHPFGIRKKEIIQSSCFLDT